MGKKISHSFPLSNVLMVRLYLKDQIQPVMVPSTLSPIAGPPSNVPANSNPNFYDVNKRTEFRTRFDTF
ncbi:ATP-dependent zinc metalloprotease FtsH [Gossypium arboreum]|uniref:ATP-dependent zinc metalloprotease FtsH n=1 Tax=Gossypium arboreum TaxID=29729 RepID=A0A0B0MSV4_GOSAR|nr:ATP-dependent zinc metalloprotease FtsH [Gossypium arboreum]